MTDAGPNAPQETQQDTLQETQPVTPRPRRGFGLSGRLLVLTILFVMIAEVLIYVPSIANFRLNWLNDRLAAAHTAALVLEAGSERHGVRSRWSASILQSIGAQAVAMKMGRPAAPAGAVGNAADGPPGRRHARRVLVPTPSSAPSTRS